MKAEICHEFSMIKTCSYAFFRLFRALQASKLQTSRVLNISTYAQLTHELIVKQGLISPRHYYITYTNA